MFAKPDYFLQSSPLTGACTGKLVCQNTAFACDHGDYAAEINTNFVGFAGPGVKALGLDGPAADQGPNSAGPDSGQLTVSQLRLPGTWVDETDIRPTLLYLAGLRDDYQTDGRVISEILSGPNRALGEPAVTALGACYKQLNSSVGDFGAATLVASTNAVESSSAGDTTYDQVNQALTGLDKARDALAGRLKVELSDAAFGNEPVHGAEAQVFACRALIGAAQHLAAAS